MHKEFELYPYLMREYEEDPRIIGENNYIRKKHGTLFVTKYGYYLVRRKNGNIERHSIRKKG